MRQRKYRAFKRGWVALYILGIGGIGALASGWNGLPRSTELSAAQMVSLRFPEESEELSPPDDPVTTGIAGGTKLALLSPTPISVEAPVWAEAAPWPPTEQPSALPQSQQTAVPLPPVVLHRVVAHPKPAPAPVHKPANRPGFVLNDAQIASIKHRLQLTPDQERMWPAVEAALRSVAYAKAHGEARRRAATASQLANIDPNSPEVQGLKSAAFPLILSFNSEQKSEVRTLAHVMGLDQLASQF